MWLVDLGFGKCCGRGWVASIGRPWPSEAAVEATETRSGGKVGVWRGNPKSKGLEMARIGVEMRSG